MGVNRSSPLFVQVKIVRSLKRERNKGRMEKKRNQISEIKVRNFSPSGWKLRRIEIVPYDQMPQNVFKISN